MTTTGFLLMVGPGIPCSVDMRNSTEILNLIIYQLGRGFWLQHFINISARYAELNTGTQRLRTFKKKLHRCLTQAQSGGKPSKRHMGFCLFIWFQDRVLLHSPDCPGTHCIDQAAFELTEIHLFLLPNCWHYNHHAYALGRHQERMIFSTQVPVLGFETFVHESGYDFKKAN